MPPVDATRPRMTSQQEVKFLRALAGSLRRNAALADEDLAHWADLANASNVDRIADRIEADANGGTDA